jgi:two-component system, cell cycle response regulator
MRLKILTVDDSKAVRMIVRKAFKNFDVDILEASNGVEGLAVASKEGPDIILLDVTMPVMDGVEMLTKLKADALLKPIPVMMLTAEAGKENVMKIAKIGIRDYVVKPFKEEVMIEKVGRIIDLKPISDESSKKRTLKDACNFLVVEDKPAIIKQITDGVAHTPWKIHGAASTGEAIDFCSKSIPDVVFISLSLPDDGASTLFKLLRSQVKTKFVPIFGLSVKTAVQEQQNAQQLGFTTIITKPIDFEELESKVAKAINLDTSERYFEFAEDHLLVKIPKSISQNGINEISAFLKPKISEAVDNGLTRVIFDAHELLNVNVNIIKLLVQAMQVCQELSLKYHLVGSAQVIAECKNFEESRDWTFFDSMEKARAAK